jgi:hypothetical protein
MSKPSPKSYAVLEFVTAKGEELLAVATVEHLPTKTRWTVMSAGGQQRGRRKRPAKNRNSCHVKVKQR